MSSIVGKLPVAEKSVRMTVSIRQSVDATVEKFVEFLAQKHGSDVKKNDIVEIILKEQMQKEKEFQAWLKKDSKKGATNDSKAEGGESASTPKKSEKPDLETERENSAGRAMTGSSRPDPEIVDNSPM